MKKQINMSELFAFCKSNQLFTCGSQAQYEKMFEAASNGITQMELALILYVCSDLQLDTIYNTLACLFKEETEHDQH